MGTALFMVMNENPQTEDSLIQSKFKRIRHEISEYFKINSNQKVRA